MPSKIFTNISWLVNVREQTQLLRGSALAHLPVIKNAYIITEDNVIAAYGSMDDCKYNTTDCISVNEGTAIMPCWCDSHTHLVFAGSREHEFIDKLNGLSYADIAAKGGGILSSAQKVQEASEDSLFNAAWTRLLEISRMGTGAVEIKSGYGLTAEGELKMLRVIKKLQQKSSLTIRSTFLGAHAYPLMYKEDHQGYIKSIIEDMLPVIAEERMADYADVFCEQNFFSAEETEVICKAAMDKGLKIKLHVNQLNSIGGIETGISMKALSLDHLETLTDEEIRLLGSFNGCATLLPSAAFFLRMDYPPARRLIHANAALTLASDYNPGSSPSGNMNFVVALSCIQMKLLPAEAFNAATVNGAHAMGIEKEVGSISAGKKANLIFTKPVQSLEYIPYSFGNNMVDKVMIEGEFL